LFSKLRVTDDDSATSTVSSELGSIRLTIEKVIAQKKSTRSRFTKPPKQHNAVHEKSKKAGTHIISYGDKERAEKKVTSYTHTLYDPSDRDPWVTFIFRYRPLDWLQAKGIVSGPAREEQTHNEVDKIKDDNDAANDIDADEIRALEERLHVLKAKRKSSSTHKASKRVKLEDLRSVRLESSGDEEVIDLT